jgi:hypothetical protein
VTKPDGKSIARAVRVAPYRSISATLTPGANAVSPSPLARPAVEGRACLLRRLDEIAWPGDAGISRCVGALDDRDPRVPRFVN